MSEVHVTTPDAIRERLRYLHDVKGMSWRKIAETDEYNDVPAGSLCSFANGWEPKLNEIRVRFGYPETIQQEVVRDELGRFAKQWRF